jgi:N-formylglutamate deformylase
LGGFLFGGKIMDSYRNIEELVRDFELNLLEPEYFHHQEHVKIAWWYLRNYTLLESLEKFSQGLKNFATRLGKGNLYHETITWAYMFLINERLHKQKSTSWEEFAKANNDLLDWQNNVLKGYYKESSLNSDLARRVFVLPLQTT